MIEKLEWKNFPGEIYTRGPGNIELGEKINEIIDYLNKQEKSTHIEQIGHIKILKQEEYKND